MIQANKLTELLIIKQLSAVSATTTGEPIEIYSVVARVYGSVLNQKGNNKFNENGGNNYFDGISFYLRYLPLCKKGLRVEYNGKDYQVENFTHVRRAEATTINLIGVK
jgi:head-tail adaptor